MLTEKANTTTSLEYLDELGQARDLTDSLYDSYLVNEMRNSTLSDSSFCSTSSSMANVKCIFNTDFVHSLGHHLAISIDPETEKVKVSDRVGFLSHFRDNVYIEDKRKVIESIAGWRLDLEYAMFVV